jgi:AcrR family transcriptional regulator
VAKSVKGKLAAASEATRNALLDAGMRILLDDPASRTFSHLTANRVASEANRTTGALFHQWPTIDDYLQDLIAHVFDPSQSKTFPELVTKIGEVMADGGTLADGIIAASRQALEVTPDDPHTIVELLMWNRSARDDEFRQLVAPLYPKLDAMGGAFIEAMVEIAGREMRPPFTAEQFAAACAGLVQGVAVREVMTPGFYPPDLLGQMIISLIPLFTRLPDDGRDAIRYTRSIEVQADDSQDDRASTPTG